MALFADRVAMASVSVGTGVMVLQSALISYRTFAAGGFSAEGSRAYYAILNEGDATWEVGLGTLTGAGTNLARDTVFASSAGGAAKVSFAAGTKSVYCTAPANSLINDQGAYPGAHTLNAVQIMRSSTAGLRPAPATYLVGELFLNMADGVIGYIDAGRNPVDLVGSGLYGYFASGTPALPGITFAADPDTGLYYLTNTLGFSTGGVSRLLLSTTFLTSTVPVVTPRGTAAAPGQTFAGDTVTGIFQQGIVSGYIGFAVGGVERFNVGAALVTSAVNIAISNAAPVLTLNDTNAALNGASDAHIQFTGGTVASPVNTGAVGHLGGTAGEVGLKAYKGNLVLDADFNTGAIGSSVILFRVDNVDAATVDAVGAPGTPLSLLNRTKADLVYAQKAITNTFDAEQNISVAGANPALLNLTDLAQTVAQAPHARITFKGNDALAGSVGLQGAGIVQLRSEKTDINIIADATAGSGGTVTHINFYIDGILPANLAARIDLAATTLAAGVDASVVTRIKGDARYLVTAGVEGDFAKVAVDNQFTANQTIQGVTPDLTLFDTDTPIASATPYARIRFQGSDGSYGAMGYNSSNVLTFTNSIGNINFNAAKAGSTILMNIGGAPVGQLDSLGTAGQTYSIITRALGDGRYLQLAPSPLTTAQNVTATGVITFSGELRGVTPTAASNVKMLVTKEYADAILGGGGPDSGITQAQGDLSSEGTSTSLATR